MKQLIFDMDGTICDLYKPTNWLDRIIKQDSTLYSEAEPLINMVIFDNLLNQLKQQGYKIIIVSWLPLNGTKEYCKQVRQAKLEWLKFYNIPTDEIHIVKYGTKKQHTLKQKQGILFDDDEKVRDAWTVGQTVNPTEQDIIDTLRGLLI